ncbi:hypothetical protein M0R88_07105 [Halorussus gelatinilyticus]|uniref:Uncharacterized protein n=1 Tax=Halorussus gelatinilyticus TaxID=2937524 RepID=A0A8U0INW2_9EURY|nr:hypothetical protein [Halorussus gelatinilyticus]UPW01854.1 hypothetical protein M0R88_07105 [Halorussus gelatinilyticus]
MNDGDVLAMCGGSVLLAAFGFAVAGWAGMGSVGAVVLVVGIVLGSEAADSADDDPPTRNCTECVAVVDGESCDYCGRSLSE